MATRLEGAIKRWIGLSTDEKPYPGLVDDDDRTLTVSDLPAGSSFFESDTGRIYRWDGAGWTYSVPAEETAYLLTRISEQLAVITRVLAEGFEVEEVDYDGPATI